MAKTNWLKVRESIAAIVAVLLIGLLLLGASAAFNWNVPGISDAARFLGIQR